MSNRNSRIPATYMRQLYGEACSVHLPDHPNPPGNPALRTATLLLRSHWATPTYA